MIRIAITSAAYTAIAATLPGNAGLDLQSRLARSPDPAVVNRLGHTGPGESYSDVIVRLARGGGGEGLAESR
jgi:hypothetical protein